jgi:hypothetical protein
MQTFATGDAAILLGTKGTGALAAFDAKVGKLRDCSALTGQEAQDCNDLNKTIAATRQRIQATLVERSECGLNAGCDASDKKYDIFGTQTNWGFMVQVDPTGILSKINLGFQRQEATLVPTTTTSTTKSGDKTASNADKDIFPSELALFSAGNVVATAPVSSDVSSGKNTGSDNSGLNAATTTYGVSQLIVTGAAADGVASDSDIETAIHEQLLATARAHEAAAQAAAKSQQVVVSQINSQAAQVQIQTDAANTNALNSAKAADIATAKSKLADVETPDQQTAEADDIIKKLSLTDLSGSIPPDGSSLSGTAWSSAQQTLKSWEADLAPEPNRPSALCSSAKTIGELKSCLSGDKLLRKYAEAKLARQSN